MRKIGVVVLSLSLILLGGCKSQSVGNCSMCGNEEKLYYIQFTVDGKDESDDSTYCETCAELVGEFYDEAEKYSDQDYKWKIKKCSCYYNYWTRQS